MPVIQTRYAGPMVLQGLTHVQVDRLRCVTKTPGSKIVHMVMRVTDTDESGGGTVWLCAKAMHKISVCMWAKQLGLSCVQSQDVFPTKEVSEDEKKHSAAYELAVRDAKDCEEFRGASVSAGSVGGGGKTKRPSSDGEAQAVGPEEAMEEEREMRPVVQLAKAAEWDEALFYWLENARHYADGVWLSERSAEDVWAHLLSMVSPWQTMRPAKKDLTADTILVTMVRVMQKHPYRKPEWAKYAQEQLEKAQVATGDDGASSKRQKVCDGEEKRVQVVASTDGSLFGFLSDQRRFEDDTQLSSKPPNEVWRHFQACADRWYTERSQEPNRDTHRSTLVKAMRNHPMATSEWRVYALDRL